MPVTRGSLHCTDTTIVLPPVSQKRAHSPNKSRPRTDITISPVDATSPEDMTSKKPVNLPSTGDLQKNPGVHNDNAPEQANVCANFEPPPPDNNAACTGMVESDGDNTSSMNDSNTPTVGESPSLKDVFSMLQVMASTMAQKNDLINVTNKIHKVESNLNKNMEALRSESKADYEKLRSEMADHQTAYDRQVAEQLAKQNKIEEILKDQQNQLDALQAKQLSLDTKAANPPPAVDLSSYSGALQNAQPFHRHTSPDKSRNAMILGVKGRNDENLHAFFNDLCNQLGLRFNNDDVLIIRRLNPQTKSDRPPPVVVSFSSKASLDRLMRAKSALKGISGFSDIWINPDEPTAIRRAKGKIRMIAAFQRKLGASVLVTSDGLKLNNEFFALKDIVSIPARLLPNNFNMDATRAAAAAAQPNVTRATVEPLPTFSNFSGKPAGGVRIVGGNHDFAGPEAPLSNFYPCSLSSPSLVDGNGVPIKFSSSEQMFQFEKARFGQDETSAKLILGSGDPFQVKQLGKGIKLPDERAWSNICEFKLKQCMRLKFQQNSGLLNNLINTSPLHLVEGTPDPYWGGGEWARHPVYESNEYPGLNRTGALLTELRDELSSTAIAQGPLTLPVDPHHGKPRASKGH